MEFQLHTVWNWKGVLTATKYKSNHWNSIYDFLVGVFSFLSYRDPNLLKTLDVYDGSGAFLRELEMDDDTLAKAIIGTIGDVDSYQLADAKGYSRYVESMF
jgi:Zn-dependent M16 (insulinase) family peptidase